MSVGHVIPIAIEEQHPTIWLVSNMLRDVKSLYNPLVPIQEKISICKTWISFLSRVKSKDMRDENVIGISISDLDELNPSKIQIVADEMISYIVQQLIPSKQSSKVISRF
ncbi:MAG: hypothetical protein QXT67_04745 [Candidatus Bathyarchaeia archaeon]